jgi:hypothetical protein
MVGHSSAANNITTCAAVTDTQKHVWPSITLLLCLLHNHDAVLNSAH